MWQVELAGRLEITQGAVSKFEHAEDVRISTLRQHLAALGARLELVAVFDDLPRRSSPRTTRSTGRSPTSGLATKSSSSTWVRT